MNQTTRSYNSCAHAYDRKFSSYTLYTERIADFARQLPRECRILDLGCGSGINAQLMNQLGHSVTGIDLSESMIDLARRRCPGLPFLKGAAESAGELLANSGIPLPFDALCLSFLIVHLEEPECTRLLGTVKNLVKSGGFLYLSFMPYAPGKAHGYESTSFSQDHIYFHYHKEEHIKAVLKEQGFQLVSEIREDYKEADGSITEDLFLIFRQST
ncbi:MAG: class I SAM-dependent methyltransferase [Spirochaetales bacterium]|nr:class I SAM-dependent methyltransferase [Spirochaetales bacterium]